MDKKVLFNEALTSIVEYASKNGNKITMDDVKKFFENLIDDESQYTFINDYLAINKIEVDGFTPTNSLGSSEADDSDNDNSDISANSPERLVPVSESEEEIKFIEMYMDEISNVEKVDAAVLNEMIAKLLSGDLDVVNNIVESQLHLVADVAQSYRGKGATFGDLIQEGNLGLMLGISEYNSDCGPFIPFITRKIKAAMEAAISEQVNSQRIGEHLAEQLNRLDEVTRNLTEELGHAPEIEDIAKAMSLTEDEVSTLLKTSLDTLAVNEDSPDVETAQIPEDQEQLDPASKPLNWKYSK